MLNKKEQKLFDKLRDRYIEKVVTPGLKTVYSFEDEEDKEQVELLLDVFKDTMSEKETNPTVIKHVAKMKALLLKQLEQIDHCPTTKAEIDAFTLFRFKFFQSAFNFLMNLAQDRAEEEFAYMEFIDTMRSVVANQEANEHDIYIVFSEDGECKTYLDGEEQDEEFFTSRDVPVFETLSSTDMALSLLVSVSPLTIRIKGSEYGTKNDFIAHIMDIFEDRVKIED